MAAMTVSTVRYWKACTVEAQAMVTFSAAVVMDTSGGTPTLALIADGRVVRAGFASGSGTERLVFAWRVDDGGLRYSNPTGLTVEMRARGLIAHEQAYYEEWGVSATLFYSAGSGDRGLTIRAGTSWGVVSGGAERHRDTRKL